MVPTNEIPRFEKAISRAKSFKDSAIAEFLILALAYFYVSQGLHRSVSPSLMTWDQLETHSGSAILIWYRWVSMPIFTFAWLRWVWRLLIWAGLLFQISRLKLRLTATHPDHAGGLAFISVGQRRFAILVLAVSSLVSASIAEEILFGGATLSDFEAELTTFFIVCVLVVMGPLIVFTPNMIQSKLKDWSGYGVLAATYTQAFEDKWIDREVLSHKQFPDKQFKDELLGHADIQSLSDLKNAYEGISQMRVFLPDRQTIAVLLLAYALPISPLLTTVIPLKKILSELVKLLMK